MVEALTYYRRKLLNTAVTPPLDRGDGDSLENDIVLSSDDNHLLLTVTSYEYMRMLSALLNGAYTTYPNDYLNVIYPLIKAGKVEFCEAVISCIESDSDVQTAINNAVKYEYYDINQPERISILESDLLSGQGQVSCDLDNLFGASTQLVDLLNTISSDVLELFETAFATPSRIGDVIEAIPVIGELPFDDALQLLEKLSQQVKSAYDAAYDSQLRDDFRCDIFCIAQGNSCQMTIEDVRNYFKDQISVDVSDVVSFATLINDIIANNWVGLQSVYMMHWFILDAVVFGTEVLGIDVNRIIDQISIFYNDPDSDHTILCDPCSNTWESTFDFVADEQGWVLADSGSGWSPQTRGVWSSGQWDDGDACSSSQCIRGVHIEFDNFDPSQIDEIEILYTMTRGFFSSGKPDASFADCYQSDGDPVERQNIIASAQNVVNHTDTAQFTQSDSTDRIILNLICSRTGGAQVTGNLVLFQVIIRGTGTKPAQFP